MAAIQTEREQRVAQARLDLARMISSIPKAYSSWSYQKTLDFKKAVDVAKKACAAARAKPESVIGAVAAVRRFYDEAR